MNRFKSAIASHKILSVAPDSKDYDKIGMLCNCHWSFSSMLSAKSLISVKKNIWSLKGLEHATSSVKDKDATTAPVRHFILQ